MCRILLLLHTFILLFTKCISYSFSHLINSSIIHTDGIITLYCYFQDLGIYSDSFDLIKKYHAIYNEIYKNSNNICLDTNFECLKIFKNGTIELFDLQIERIDQNLDNMIILIRERMNLTIGIDVAFHFSEDSDDSIIQNYERTKENFFSKKREKIIIFRNNDDFEEKINEFVNNNLPENLFDDVELLDSYKMYIRNYVKNQYPLINNLKLESRLKIEHNYNLYGEINVGFGETIDGILDFEELKPSWVYFTVNTFDVTDTIRFKELFKEKGVINRIKSEHVLEHLNLVELIAALSNIYEYLAEDGNFRFAIPDYNWNYHNYLYNINNTIEESVIFYHR